MHMKGQKINMAKDEKKVEEPKRKAIIAYTVTRYDDGSVDVADASLEGTTKVTSADIYKDIEDVDSLIVNKRMENAAYVGAYNGVQKFYQDVAAQAKSQAEPTVGK